MGRKLCTVCHIKSPHHFWVRFNEAKSDYEKMLANLQADYASPDDSQ